ncbi:Tigger transposable element-derived protein 7-like 25 [Homarus americanus]|uniref:Tigger transposable element-derived protein 7-like 25 n=1 Tax=Homarus americanus TaxID=6706 RepID=A0A8J5K2Y0_HOMAM|nr:Tigger transposable element-derived protein 7-like 25 [Homarus americanus]
MSVACVCDEYDMKKQTVSDKCKAKDKLTTFAMKYDVDGASTASPRKHMKVPKDKELEEAVHKWFVQQHACGVKVREVEIAAAANKQAQYLGIPFKAGDGWLWRFWNRHGIHNRKLHGETGSTQTEEVEPFMLKLNQLIKDEGLNLAQVYNAGVTGLFWRSLPKNTLVFNHEVSTPGQKDIKISALANSWKKLLLDTEPEFVFEGFAVMDFHQMLHLGVENNITMEDVETWLDENEGDPGYQMLLAEEIADAVRAVDTEDDDAENNDEE